MQAWSTFNARLATLLEQQIEGCSRGSCGVPTFTRDPLLQIEALDARQIALNLVLDGHVPARSHSITASRSIADQRRKRAKIRRPMQPERDRR